jgi:hypothetical protein
MASITDLPHSQTYDQRPNGTQRQAEIALTEEVEDCCDAPPVYQDRLEQVTSEKPTPLLPLHQVDRIKTCDTSFLIGSDPDEHSTRKEFKLTGYLITNIVVLLGFGIAKGVMFVRGGSIIPSSLEMAVGAVACLLLYLIGLWEPIRPSVAIWYFHKDYLHPLKTLVAQAAPAALFSLALFIFFFLIAFTTYISLAGFERLLYQQFDVSRSQFGSGLLVLIYGWYIFRQLYGFWRHRRSGLGIWETLRKMYLFVPSIPAWTEVMLGIAILTVTVLAFGLAWLLSSTLLPSTFDTITNNSTRLDESL